MRLENISDWNLCNTFLPIDSLNVQIDALFDLLDVDRKSWRCQPEMRGVLGLHWLVIEDLNNV